VEQFLFLSWYYMDGKHPFPSIQHLAETSCSVRVFPSLSLTPFAIWRNQWSQSPLCEHVMGPLLASWSVVDDGLRVTNVTLAVLLLRLHSNISCSVTGPPQ
jgi:hypothetical protein